MYFSVTPLLAAAHASASSLHPSIPPLSSFIDLALVKLVCEINKRAGMKRFAWIHEVTWGCDVRMESSKENTENNAGKVQLKERLTKLRLKQENELYEEMIKSVEHKQVHEPGEMASIRTQLSIGLNVLAAMATGAIFGYYVGNTLFGDVVYAYICALIGIILAMALEIWLFILREEKESILEERKTKVVQKGSKMRP